MRGEEGASAEYVRARVIAEARKRNGGEGSDAYVSVRSLLQPGGRLLFLARGNRRRKAGGPVGNEENGEGEDKYEEEKEIGKFGLLEVTKGQVMCAALQWRKESIREDCGTGQLAEPLRHQKRRQ